MKMEERAIDEDRVEYGLDNGLYVLCVRDPRSGKVVVGFPQSEATGERADEVRQRTALPPDYRERIRRATQAHFYPTAPEAAA